MKRRRAGRVFHLDIGIHQPEHRRHVDQPLPDRAINEPEQVERAEQLRQVCLHEHQIAGGQLALAPAPHGVGHRACHQQVGDERLCDVEQAERSVRLDRGFGILPRRLGIALVLTRLGTEIFDRLVIQQRIDRTCQRLPIEIVHLAPQLGPPFGDHLSHRDIGDHGDAGRKHQPDAEIEVEDHRNRNQLDQRGRDVEQQEVQHRVDAFGPALDRLGDFARAARQMEAQRQLVQAAEHVLGELAGGVLPDALEDHVADIVERDAGEASRGIGDHEGYRDHRHGVGRRGHRVDRRAVGIGKSEHGRLGDQHQRQRDHDADAKVGAVLGPEIGQEAPQRLPALGRVGLFIGRCVGRPHRCALCGDCLPARQPGPHPC